jgi:hypothetical protein
MRTGPILSPKQHRPMLADWVETIPEHRASVSTHWPPITEKPLGQLIDAATVEVHVDPDSVSPVAQYIVQAPQATVASRSASNANVNTKEIELAFARCMTLIR